ncbi:MAG: hypothetical protein WDM86_08770 [Rhizomicrobium sp.]
MAHVYEVHTSHGRKHQVETNHHHGDYTETEFKKILHKIIEGSASGAASGTAAALITLYIYKGKK